MSNGENFAPIRNSTTITS